MKKFLDPIRPSLLTAKKFVGFFSGVIAALGGFYAFMVADWWGYTKTTVAGKPIVENVDGVDVTKVTNTVNTSLNTALNLQGFLGAITPAAILAIVLGAWGAATLKKVEQRFWATMAFGTGLAVLFVVLWVNVFTAGKVGEHYWRGVAFMAITLIVWCLQAAYYHVPATRRRRRTTTTPTPTVVI